ncbi:MAG: tetratricopeptide repeat protein [Treponema sp.]|nr:tetratricopeptide repeat protein [Candidatus Treponema equi]
MKKSSNGTLSEIIVAFVLVCVVSVVFSITLSSCGSVPAAQPSADKAEVVAKEEPKPQKKPAKKEYTKVDFIEDLQRTLEADGPDAALEFFDKKIPAKSADDFDLLFLKAAINVSGNHLDEAQEMCDMLSARDPDNQDVISLATAIAKMRGDTAEKNKRIKELLAKDKYNPTANVELGTEQLLKKNYKQAKDYYTKALAREPKNEDALLGKGQCEYYLERDDEAKELLQKLVDVNPYNVDAYLYLGKIAYANDEYKIASDHAKKALDIDPERYECNMDYGMYERYLGHFDNALKSWTKAIEIEPDYFLAYAYRAGLYDEENQYDKALKDYLMVVKLNPQYYYAYESIGVLALLQKDFKMARESFMKCFERNKTNISYPLMITYCYYMEKNDKAAKDFSNQVLRKMDRNSVDYTMLRVFHDKAGEKPLKQRIGNMNNRNQQGKMYYYLGLFYDMFGADEGAKEFYAKVVAMNCPMFFEYRLAEVRVKETGGSL